MGHIVPDGAAHLDGRIRTGDEIVSVDNVSVIGASHRKVVSIMGQAALRGLVTLGIRRRLNPSTGQCEQRYQTACVNHLYFSSQSDVKNVCSCCDVGTRSTHQQTLPSEHGHAFRNLSVVAYQRQILHKNSWKPREAAHHRWLQMRFVAKHPLGIASFGFVISRHLSRWNAAQRAIVPDRTTPGWQISRRTDKCRSWLLDVVLFSVCTSRSTRPAALPDIAIIRLEAPKCHL